MYYCFSDDKKAGIQDTVRETVLLQAALLENFSEKFLSDIPEYQVLQRVLGEQAQFDKNGERVPKDKRDISADSG